MTLIIVLQGRECLVLAADSRALIPGGETAWMTDAEQKIVPVGRWSAVGVLGNPDVGTRILSDALATLPDYQETQAIHALAEMLGAVARAQYQEWFQHGGYVVPPPLAFVLVGYQGTIPYIFTVRSELGFAPTQETTGSVLLGYARLALYLRDRLYSPDLELTQLTRLAVLLVMETTRYEPQTGLPVHATILTPQDGLQALDAKTVRRLMHENNSAWERLRQSFKKAR